MASEWDWLQYLLFKKDGIIIFIFLTTAAYRI